MFYSCRAHEVVYLVHDVDLVTADARFSPPSVSVSLDGPKLWVDVAFPCAPSVLCQSDEEKEQGDEAAELSCCSITRLLQPNTSVILYNKHDAADTQTYTKEFETSPSRVEFGWLVAGQEYCAVAHFASSPRSEPKCIHVPLQGSLNVAVLCGMLIALLLIAVCFLGRRWASSDTRLPKNLMSLQNVDQESPFVVECGQAALEEEENSIVLLSIVPLYSTSDLSEPGSQSACLCSQSLEDVRRYYASSILQHQAFDEHDGDTGSHLETDGDSPSDQYPGHLWPLDPALRTGQACLREDCLPLGDLGVPLSSVKVAGGQREEMELDHVHEVLMNLKMVNDSQLVSDRDHGE
ncbi:uncharacterized protein [Salminus brasiliensis]|uniref:uncharacterized protein n=1 Tax=Salminus brasiliensis TaxID=930266 RepID=UPI003B82DBE0